MSQRVHDGLSPLGLALAYRWRGPGAALVTGVQVDVVAATSGPRWTHLTEEGDVVKTYPSSWTTVRLPTGWGADLVDGDATDLVVGGVFDARFEVLSWSYAVTWTSTYSGALTIGPWAAWRREAGERWTIEADVGVPLVGWVARSPYALNDDEYMQANRTHDPVVTFLRYVADGRVASIADYQAFRMRLGAARQLGRNTTLVGAWRFELLHDPEPRPAVAYGHAVDLGVRWSL